MKIIEKKKILSVPEGLPFILNEIEAHWVLEHCEGVLKLLGLHEDSTYVILILEYHAKGSLMQCLKNQKRFSEPEVKIIME